MAKQLVTKPGRQPKKVQGDGEPLASDWVYWGLVDGDGVPEMLVTEKKWAETWRGALPEAQRARVSVVRTYVTIWRLSKKARRPAKG